MTDNKKKLIIIVGACSVAFLALLFALFALI